MFKTDKLSVGRWYVLNPNTIPDKSVTVKIPKGTIVNVSGLPLRLTKSLYVKDVSGQLVIDNSSLTTNFDYLKTLKNE